MAIRIKKADGTWLAVPVGSEVSASSTGTSTDHANYITIDGVEHKVKGGSDISVSLVPTGTPVDEVRIIKLDDNEHRISGAKVYDSISDPLVNPGPEAAPGDIWVTNAPPATINQYVKDATLDATAEKLTLTLQSATPSTLEFEPAKANVALTGTENPLKSVKIGNILWNNQCVESATVDSSGAQLTLTQHGSTQDSLVYEPVKANPVMEGWDWISSIKVGSTAYNSNGMISGTVQPSGDVPAVDALALFNSDRVMSTYDEFKKFFDILYPVGSYAFGTHPACGTWEEITGDQALWIKDTEAEGTLISQSLPKPSVTVTVAKSGAHYHQWKGYYGVNSTGGDRQIKSKFNVSGDPTDTTTISGTEMHTHSGCTLTVNTSGAYGTGTKVQPDAYVMTVWKRTA